MTGDWPSFMIGYKDHNPYNLQWKNLKKVTHVDRVARYKNVGKKLEELNRPTLNPKKQIRAIFREEDVSKAIEEYICPKMQSSSTCVPENFTNPKETK